MVDEQMVRIVFSLWNDLCHEERMTIIPKLLDTLSIDESAEVAKRLSARFSGEIPW